MLRDDSEVDIQNLMAEDCSLFGSKEINSLMVLVPKSCLISKW